jgi:hypothetical protein
MKQKRTFAQLSLIVPLVYAVYPLLSPRDAHGDDQCVTKKGFAALSGYTSYYRPICTDERDGVCVKRGVESKSAEVFIGRRNLKVKSHTRHDRYPIRTEYALGCFPIDETYLCRAIQGEKDFNYEHPRAFEFVSEKAAALFVKDYHGFSVSSSSDGSLTTRLYTRALSFVPVPQPGDSDDTTYCFNATVKGIELDSNDAAKGTEKVIATTSQCIEKGGFFDWSIPVGKLHVITSSDVTKTWKSKRPSRPITPGRPPTGKPSSWRDADNFV